MFIIKDIDIIIPCYNSAKTLPATLASIAMQSIKDKCNVYICDDCGTDDYTDIITTFSTILDITCLKSEHNGGAGLARQMGIDNSKSLYIVFIDSDDTFSNSFAIEMLYQKMIEKPNNDVVVGDFEEQIDKNGKVDFISHGFNPIWLHGKMFKRDYLDNFNIRFNATRLNEDVYFLGLIWATTENIVHLDKAVYTWRTNENSLTRNITDNLARYKVIVGFVDNQIKLYQEKKRRGIENTNISVQQSVDALIVLYFYCNEIFSIYNDDTGNDFLEECMKFYKEVWNDVKSIATNDYLNERYTTIITDMGSAKMFIPVMTLYEFVDIIKN